MSLEHTFQMFHLLNILKIYHLIDFNTCIFMHTVFHKLVHLKSQNNFSMSLGKKYKNVLYVCLQEQEENNLQ